MECNVGSPLNRHKIRLSAPSLKKLFKKSCLDPISMGSHSSSGAVDPSLILACWGLQPVVKGLETGRQTCYYERVIRNLALNGPCHSLLLWGSGAAKKVSFSVFSPSQRSQTMLLSRAKNGVKNSLLLPMNAAKLQEMRSNRTSLR